MKNIVRAVSLYALIVLTMSCRYGVFVEYTGGGSIGDVKGIVEIHDNIGDWDAAYVTEHGYFCYKEGLQVKSEDKGALSSLTYMSSSQTEMTGLLATRNECIPTQLVGKDGILYFSFPNDTILELLFDDGIKVEMIDSVAFKKSSLPGLEAELLLDPFKAILANTSSLLEGALNLDKAGFAVNIKDLFEEVSGLDYVENSDIIHDINISESGNYEFADIVDEWYDDEIEEVVYNTLSLWTGKATFKVGGSSCTLSGTIWCPSDVFNDYGTYGIICDADVDNLYFGKAEYQGAGYQASSDLSFDVDFRGFKPNTTYYYRAYYRFDSTDHGNIIPKYGNLSDQVFYDTTIKSFRTGDNNLTVDVVMCIDVTGSMSDIINTVKSNAISFYDLFNECCVENGITMTGLNTQVIAFRDKNVDGDDWMSVSPTYTLPEEKSEFQSFVNALDADGGGDMPESGLEALQVAFEKSDWGVDDGYHRQVVILWTDAPYLVGESYTDLVISDAEYMWNSMPSGRRMILFAPNGTSANGGSWGELDTWANVIHETDLDTGFRDFEYILESIISELTGKARPASAKKMAETSVFRSN